MPSKTAFSERLVRPGGIPSIALGYVVLLAGLIAVTDPIATDPPRGWPARHVLYPAYEAPVSSAESAPMQLVRQYEQSGAIPQGSVPDIGRGDRYGQTVLGHQPLAYWRLDDDAVVMTDETGRYSGTHPTEVVRVDEAGTESAHTRYDGRDDYSIVQSMSEFHASSELSVELWIRNLDLDRRSIPISKAGGLTRSDSEWWVEWQQDNRVSFRVWQKPGSVLQVVSSRSYDSYWHHVVATYDRSSIRLYVDGELAGKANYSGDLYRVNAPLVLGNVRRGLSTTAFRGDVDDVAIYERPLLPSEVTEHYEIGGTTIREYTADAVWWKLLPSSWKEHASWQMTLSEEAVVEAVLVEGREVKETEENFQTSYLGLKPDILGVAYAVPNELIGGQTTIALVARGSPPAPEIKFFMTRPTSQPAGGVGTVPPSSSAASAAPDDPWWKTNLWVACLLTLMLVVIMSALVRWSYGQLRAIGFSPRQRFALTAVFAALFVFSTLTTNLDIQIFKGVGERYWLYGPLRGLTLSGFGPIIDALFVLPMLPYLLLSDALGMTSEFALNAAMRIPMLVGTLFMLAAATRLARAAGLSDARTRTLVFVLLLNPIVLVWVVWHPEAIIVGLVALAVAFVFENRVALGGVLFGTAVASKYWPLFAGPVLLMFVWRSRDWRSAVKWVVAGGATVFALIASYWIPTMLSLSSFGEFARLLEQRFPYFGGSQASSFSTIWSLYKVPQEIASSAAAKSTVAGLEQRSFFVVLAFFVLISALYARQKPTKLPLIVSLAAVFSIAASVNSLSVAGFALWGLPFLVIALQSSIRWSNTVLMLAVASWSSAVLVTVFVEPVSYWFLHSSVAVDEVALATSDWLARYVVNSTLASGFGFVFCLTLAGVGVLLTAGLVPWSGSRLFNRWRGIWSQPNVSTGGWSNQLRRGSQREGLRGESDHVS